MIQKKICMVGVFGVGKTCLVQQYVHSIFAARYLSTVGVKIDRKDVKSGDQDIRLVLWDLECPYCMKSLRHLAAAQRTDPKLKVVTVSTDPMQSADEIAARLAQLGVRSEAYAFGDAPREALQYAIDATWLGEKPRAYRYSADGKREAISGVIQLPTSAHRNP